MSDASSEESFTGFLYEVSDLNRLVTDPHQERGPLNDRDWKQKLRQMIAEVLRHEDFYRIEQEQLYSVLNSAPTPQRPNALG